MKASTVRRALVALLASLCAAAAVAGILAEWSAAAPAPAAHAADAPIPVPISDLQLDTTSVTRAYGQQISVVGTCTGIPQSFQTTASLSADPGGDGLLTIGTENLGGQAHAITQIGPGQLELDYSGSVTVSGQTDSAVSTFQGYGTSFSGTYALTIPTQDGLCTTTRTQTLTLTGTGLTEIAPLTTSTDTSSATSTATTTTTTTTSTSTSTSASTTGSTTTTSSSTSTGSGGGGSASTSSPPTLAFPCSTGAVSPCTVTTINLAGSPFNPVDGYLPQGTAAYKQLLALGFIPVSGECDEACVIEVQALLSSGQLKLGPRVHAAAAHLKSIGKVRLRIARGSASADLRFTAAGRKLLRAEKAKHFEIVIRLWATTPAGKRLGKVKVAHLRVRR